MFFPMGSCYIYTMISNPIKNIAVLTSGGDSPGMNACIRAVVRVGIDHGCEVTGVYRGFDGLIDADFVSLATQDVSNIIQRGGTILKSARASRFMELKYRRIGYENMRNAGIDALVVIGGDGTFMGAQCVVEEMKLPTLGLPGTIDNDLYGTDNTIGYDTALNTVVSAVDKIRDTADAHERLFIIEVMGKDAGFIAARSGIAVGAEAILIPETTTYIDDLIDRLKTSWRNNKKSSIIIVAEGDDLGGALEVEKKIQEQFNKYDTRVSILGYVQRGGSPSAYDRLLASRLGAEAVHGVIAGKTGFMVGVKDNEISYTPLLKAVKHNKLIRKDLIDLATVLSK